MFAHIHDSIPGNLVQYGRGDEECGEAPRATTLYPLSASNQLYCCGDAECGEASRATARGPTAPLYHSRPY